MGREGGVGGVGVLGVDHRVSGGAGGRGSGELMCGCEGGRRVRSGPRHAGVVGCGVWMRRGVVGRGRLRNLTRRPVRSQPSRRRKVPPSYLRLVELVSVLPPRVGWNATTVATMFGGKTFSSHILKSFSVFFMGKEEVQLFTAASAL